MLAAARTGRRAHVSAMSFGTLSGNANEALDAGGRIAAASRVTPAKAASAPTTYAAVATSSGRSAPATSAAGTPTDDSILPPSPRRPRCEGSPAASPWDSRCASAPAPSSCRSVTAYWTPGSPRTSYRRRCRGRNWRGPTGIRGSPEMPLTESLMLVATSWSVPVCGTGSKTARAFNFHRATVASAAQIYRCRASTAGDVKTWVPPHRRQQLCTLRWRDRPEPETGPTRGLRQAPGPARCLRPRRRRHHHHVQHCRRLLARWRGCCRSRWAQPPPSALRRSRPPRPPRRLLPQGYE